MSKKISVVMVVKDEEQHMRECLERIPWADEIIILDNGSTDKSMEIAKQYNAKIYKDTSPFSDFLYDKAIEKATSEWIFLLDPDERVTKGLGEQIKQILTSPKGSEEKTGYYIPFKHIFLGRWLKHGGWYPSYLLRVVRREHAKIQGPVHNLFSVNKEQVGYLSDHIIHYGDVSIAQRVTKINIYSSIEAKYLFKEKNEISYMSLFTAGFILFVKSYIWKKGFLDGNEGFIRAVFLFYTTFLARAKIYEMNIKVK